MLPSLVKDTDTFISPVSWVNPAATLWLFTPWAAQLRFSVPAKPGSSNPQRTSFPPPPLMTSLPKPPKTVSLPAPELIVSLPPAP